MKLKKSYNAVLYFSLVCVFLLLLFFTNDFSLTDVQETSIVIAVGIDKEEDEFLITSQVSLPSAKDEGGPQTTQVLSRGKTVAQAFSSLNAKTGWYPKLVFCKLIILGAQAVEENVFTALDYFLRSEYIPDNCLVCVSEKTAGELLEHKTPIDKISGIALQKVLSDQAKRLGTAAPVSLKDFSMQYFAEGKSGVLPIVKTDKPKGEESSNQQNSSQGNQNSSSGQSNSSGSVPKTSGEEKLFKADDCALFSQGKKVGELTGEEAFALYASKEKLRLAEYSLPFHGEEYTLNFRLSKPKTDLKIDENGLPRLKIALNITAGLSDTSKALPLSKAQNQGQMPDGLLSHAEEKLKGEIERAFEKCRQLNCDALELFTKLKRTNDDYYPVFQEDLLKRVQLSVSVKMDNVR
ncbi:MAG: hypothetical protein IJY38_04590 [Clostridia bacterium]|nr:hypothetical protein [Clostridia bacterium]